jgi:SulP family sulfate permease
MPEHFVERVGAMIQARGTASLAELSVGLVTLGILIYFPATRARARAPGGSAAGGAPRRAPLLADPRRAHCHHLQPLPHRDRRPRAGRDPPAAAAAHDPLLSTGPDGHRCLTFQMLRELLPGAFAIAMLGAIESLLSAVVADGMARTKHDPDAELLALGSATSSRPSSGASPPPGPSPAPPPTSAPARARPSPPWSTR